MVWCSDDTNISIMETLANTVLCVLSHSCCVGRDLLRLVNMMAKKLVSNFLSPPPPTSETGGDGSSIDERERVKGNVN